ncbi:MAG: HD domain-containing protein [Candidatus Eremiobacteraeota bacterium]|nr:HD domain-containing protein [Candidatus Eremiobacteraeota bacterium]
MPKSLTPQILAVLGIIVFLFTVLGFYIGATLEKMKGGRKKPSPQPAKDGEPPVPQPSASFQEPPSAKSKEVLNSLFSTLLSVKGKEPDEIYSILASFIINNSGADYSAIFLREGEDFVLSGSAGFPADLIERLKVPDAFIRWLKEKNQPVFLHEKQSASQMKFFKSLQENISEVLLYPFKPGNELMGVLLVMNKRKPEEFSEHEKMLFATVNGVYAFYIHNMNLDKELEKTYINTTVAIAIFLEKRDKYTQGHSERVKEFSQKLARKLGRGLIPQIDKRFVDRLGLAASLHDIGKIGIPDAILNKPGKLNDEEYAQIKDHSEIGARMLEPLSFLRDCIPGILHHHEKFDGTGYPRKIAGDKIPIEAQIITIADVYDALTTDRPYRTRYTHEEAIEIMNEMNKKHFNPDMYREFIHMFSAETKSQPKEAKM